MFRVEDAVFILTGRVDDLRRKVLALVLEGTAEGVFDGGVVGFDERAFDEADCEGGFACERDVISILASVRQFVESDVPTARLPTTAILRCFGGATMIVNASRRQLQCLSDCDQSRSASVVRS